MKKRMSFEQMLKDLAGQYNDATFDELESNGFYDDVADFYNLENIAQGYCDMIAWDFADEKLGSSSRPRPNSPEQLEFVRIKSDHAKDGLEKFEKIFKEVIDNPSEFLTSTYIVNYLFSTIYYEKKIEDVLEKRNINTEDHIKVLYNKFSDMLTDNLIRKYYKVLPMTVYADEPIEYATIEDGNGYIKIKVGAVKIMNDLLNIK